MGRLFRAWDPRLGREAALKVLADQFSNSREHLVRFEQEARAASALNHPGADAARRTHRHPAPGPEDLALLAPRVLEALTHVVRRCLAKEPEGRSASTRDLAHDLASIRERPTGSRSLSTARLRAGAPPWRGRAVAVPAALAVAVAAGALWFARASGPETAETAAAVIGRRIASLPFRDLSATPSDALIGEDFAETVSARLGSGSALAVLPAVAVGEEAGDLPALFRRTGAQPVVRGSLQFEGSRVRSSSDSTQTRNRAFRSYLVRYVVGAFAAAETPAGRAPSPVRCLSEARRRRRRGPRRSRSGSRARRGRAREGGPSRGSGRRRRIREGRHGPKRPGDGSSPGLVLLRPQYGQ